MKTIISLVLLLVIVSCTKQRDVPSIPESGKLININLAIGGDAVEVAPLMTKAASDDLTAIQISWRAKGGTTYKPYAWGIFDDISNLSAQLLDGLEYRIEATTVVDGKNKIARGIGNAGYRQPFSVSGTLAQGLIMNQFNNSSVNNLTGINQGYSAIIDGSKYTLLSRPFTDRYYGLTENYTPVDQKSLTLSMKRVVFGIKFTVTGLDNGTLEVDFDKSSLITLTTTNASTYSEIITMQGGNSNWSDDSYSENVKLKIVWIREDGITIDVVNKEYNFRRKTLSSIKINLEAAFINSGIVLQREESALTPADDITISNKPK